MSIPTSSSPNSSPVPTSVAPASLVTPSVPVAYQAPAIESVFTPDDLQREVFYAGGGGPGNIPSAPV